MLGALVARRLSAEFIYCARSRREGAFIERLEALAKAGGVKLSLHFDDENGGPPDLRQLLAGRPAQSHLYCCGPGPMLEAFNHACERLGYENVHTERFAAMESPTPLASGHGADQSYRVELRRSGKVLDVTPGKSLLDALLEAGVSQDYSCREGVCGACETKVLSGEIDHRDSILTKAEREAGKTMMVCVSRCKQGPLTLDI
jgi:ferredoxin